jgi:hypothetical protein
MIFPLLYAMNQIDFKDPENVMKVRIGYALVQVVSLAIYGYIYSLASSSKDTKKIKVAPPPSFGQQE